MAASLDVQNLEPGTVLLDKYRVVRQLGAGGMGVVVHCEHISLRTQVALKFLLPQYVDRADAAGRFVREARAATRVQSPHIAQVIDVGTLHNGVPYMVMEYLDGQDLLKHLRSGREFSIHEAIDFIAQASHALAQAHHVGIIHRDVKPANLFLANRTDGGQIVKVLDFGISKVLEANDLSLTKTTSVLGSGLYMSPEQMRSAKNVDTRTDVYALGVCIYEILTHTLPFVAESFSELVMKVNLEPADPIRRHRPEIPEGLAEVIHRALAKNLDERYPSIVAFVTALQPWAAPETVPMIEAVQRVGTTEEFKRLPSVAPPRMSTPPPPSGITSPGSTATVNTVAPKGLSPAAVALIVIGAFAITLGGLFYYRRTHTDVPKPLVVRNDDAHPPVQPGPPLSAVPDVSAPPMPSAIVVAPSASAVAAPTTSAKTPKLPKNPTPCGADGSRIDKNTGLRIPCL